MTLLTFAMWCLISVSIALVVALAVRAAITAWITFRAAAWLPPFSRRLAFWVLAHPYRGDAFFRADGAGPSWLERRRRGLDRLAASLDGQYPQATAWARGIRDSFSDLRFTDASRVPFAFAPEMRDRFDLYSVVTASHGPHLRHLDGHWTVDVSGSYGLNVAGFDQYKQWIDDGLDRVRDLGPVLGPLHPVVAENIATLKQLSGLDEVSFHMSGTEAVMAAVRLARFNTRRRLIVCFSGAYHGWWDGVQPGLGSERSLDDCLTLKDMSRASLRAIRRRAREIAAVLVNPVQSFHPNTPPPNDAVLLTSQVRQAAESHEAYAKWLHELRALCREVGVPFILDEVYTGFRLAPGGAQTFFGIDADMVVYGKTVAGGMPIGVVCGRSWLMRRTDPARPMRMAYVVGTFSAHPLVMGAMREFLNWVTDARAGERYQQMNDRCAAWIRATNQAMAEASLPLRLVHLGSIWTVLFKETGRYNWLLQYYLRAAGVTLSWVGTGRCLVSMDFTDDDYRLLQAKLVAAARQMADDGWWLDAQECPGKDRLMKKQLTREVLGSLVPAPVQRFYAAVMKRKEDDHHASHNNIGNQYLHLLSSSAFIYCYAILAFDLTQAMFIGLASLFIRQFGHAVLEPACHDEEETLLGYNTRNKSLIVAVYAAIPLFMLIRTGLWSLSGFLSLADPIALRWFQWTLVVVFGRVAYLTWAHDLRTALIWFAKLVTDPFTDLVAYFRGEPSTRDMEIAVFAACAMLLTLERLTYIWIWRQPDQFRMLVDAGTRTGGNPVNAVRHLFLAFKVVQAGAFAGWCLAFGHGRLLPIDAPPAAIAAGAVLLIAGQLLNASVFYRLGTAGVFYGSRFGLAVPWTHAFPFSWLSHPQYVGTVLSIWGLFLILRFPNPDWYVLPLLESAYYAIGARLEQSRPAGAGRSAPAQEERS